MSYKSNLSFNQDYVNHWNKPFDRPEKIYVVFGNTDSDDFETALSIDTLDRFGGDKKEFTCFKEMAEYIAENKDDFTDLFCLVDASYEDPDASSDFASKVDDADYLDLFKLMTDHKSPDPILFVRETNSLLQWLRRVRKCSSF